MSAVRSSSTVTSSPASRPTLLPSVASIASSLTVSTVSNLPSKCSYARIAVIILTADAGAIGSSAFFSKTVRPLSTLRIWAYLVSVRFGESGSSRAYVFVNRTAAKSIAAAKITKNFFISDSEIFVDRLGIEPNLLTQKLG